MSCVWGLSKVVSRARNDFSSFLPKSQYTDLSPKLNFFCYLTGEKPCCVTAMETCSCWGTSYTPNVWEKITDVKFYQYDLRLAKIHTEALIRAWQQKFILVSLSPLQLLVIQSGSLSNRTNGGISSWHASWVVLHCLKAKKCNKVGKRWEQRVLSVKNN